MRKFLYLLMACTLLFGVTACTDDSFSFEYNFNIDGHATGDVDVTFPGGELTLNGQAELGFEYASAPSEKPSLSSFQTKTIQELRESGRKNWDHVADVVLTEYDAAFTASSADGTYYLHITGSVKEKLTGLEVKIDKVLTNESPSHVHKEDISGGSDYKSE